jgi:hypothetical protein
MADKTDPSPKGLVSAMALMHTLLTTHEAGAVLKFDF